jgi:hypothetical protein
MSDFELEVSCGGVVTEGVEACIEQQIANSTHACRSY